MQQYRHGRMPVIPIKDSLIIEWHSEQVPFILNQGQAFRVVPAKTAKYMQLCSISNATKRYNVAVKRQNSLPLCPFYKGTCEKSITKVCDMIV